MTAQTTAQAPAKREIPGLTHADFQGVSTSTLRYWLRFWEGKTREKMSDEQKPLAPAEVKKVGAEIAAREAARSKGGPTA